MRNIWTVFKTDIRTLSKCFFACVVVVAIALLPSLYAWLNIYSNWDPYGNTGGISIAVASLDEGYTDADGTYENKGDDVVADLREATSINWVIVDTEEQAKGGVESGDYYAAVVIDKQFSRNMYRMLTDWTGKPAITYYENAKKNAVATKITDTAVETLKRSISENYLEVVIDGIMEQSNLLAADLTADDPEAAVKGVLYQAQDLLHACGRMMDAFEAAGGSGVSESSAAALEAAVANINKNLPDGAQLQQTAAEIQMRLNTALARVERALDRLNSAMETRRSCRRHSSSCEMRRCRWKRRRTRWKRGRRTGGLRHGGGQDPGGGGAADGGGVPQDSKAAAGIGGEPGFCRPAGGLRRVGEVHPDDGGQDPRDLQGAAKGAGHRGRSGGGHHGGHGCAGWRRQGHEDRAGGYR